MEILIGFLAALVTMSLFGVGVLVGWKAKSYDTAHRSAVTAEALTVEQKRRVQEEQEAWMALHNYSVEDAYNLQRDPHAAKKE